MPQPASRTDKGSEGAAGRSYLMSGSETLPTRKSFSGRAVGAMLAAGVAVAGGQALAQPSGGAETAPRLAAGAPPVVAVMPFVNVSGRPGDDWLGTGIAETVISGMQQSGGLAVMDRWTPGAAGPAAGAGGDESRAREEARAAGVSWLVAGGFQRVDDRLRIVARVVEVESGTVREIAKIDGRADELFALQDRIATEVLQGLSGRVRPARPARARPRAEARMAAAVARPDAGAARVAPRPGPASAVTGLGGGSGSAPAPPPRRPGRRPGASAAGPSGGGAGFAPVPAGDAGVLAGRVTVRPRRTTTPPTVDGLLDDAVWSNAARITEFVQREPVDGAPASEDTDVFVAYDDTHLYLAFHAKYENPEILRASRVDRDRAGFSDDTISVYFDPFLDQQRAYVFQVNGYGVQGDSIVSGGRGGGFSGGGRGGVPRGDRSWDALYTSGGQPVADGFTAEMAIPFKSLRYPARPGNVPHTWGFQIVRQIRDKDETIVWSPVSRDIAGFLPQMGVLDGMTGLSTSRNLEVQPTFTAFRYGSYDEEAGRLIDGRPQPDVGANFKYGVTPNIIADFTLNPDFSQIESDRPQVEVNQRFALFYPELRPFFLEGAEIFQIQAPVTVVHTRTIVDPQYGAKLTGKAGKTTLGVLFADDEGASLGIDDRLDPAFGQSAQTFVGRVRYDLYSESYVGGIVTDREFLDRYSRLVGVDSNFRIGTTHQLGFRALGTDRRVAGRGPDTISCAPAAVPDSDGSTTCDGYALDFGFRKRGRNLSYSIDSFALSPDFQTDVGFVRRTDQRETEARVDYLWWPQSWVISWGPEARYSRNYNFNRVLDNEDIRVGWAANFAKNIRYSFDLDQDMERYQGFDFDKRRYRMYGSIYTSRILSLSTGYDWGDEIYFDRANPFLGRESGFRTYINFRPVPRFATNLSIRTSRFTDPLGLFVAGLNRGERDEEGEVFNVNIFRALNTYQFTDRLALRNITEFNTYRGTVGLNLLATYRVNSGTAFYIGYDDHYRQYEVFDDQVNAIDRGYLHTNRAVFTKIQYLFRY